MNIATNLSRIQQRMEKAALRSNRNPAEVRLIAVSKIHSASAIRAAYDAGQRRFGENYVQETLQKQEAPELAELHDIEWHFIGHLQRNKTRQLIGRVALIETIDSLRLLHEVAKRAQQGNQTVDVLLQVNIALENTKSGCLPQDLGELLSAAKEQCSLRIRGLMAIPPLETDAEISRGYFRLLRDLREEHGGPKVLPELSMGMSHDFEVAIEEGATLVRVGTAVFGPRQR